MASLNKKLERKVLKDVDSDLKASFEKMNILKFYELADKSENDKENASDNIITEKNKQIKIQSLVRDCLGLLKCMKVEGDVDMDKNSFYLRILKRISDVYAEEEINPKMHKFSNTLIQIIEKFKNTSK